MNKKLEELMYDLTCVGTIKGQNETKAAIRELFQAQIYADANIGELITALHLKAYHHGWEACASFCQHDDEDAGYTDLMAEKEAAAAEAALREALGVQR